MRKKLALLGAIFGAGAVLYSCGGGGGGTTGTTAALYLTDKPANQYDSFEVTVYEVNLCIDSACSQKETVFQDPNGVVIDFIQLNQNGQSILKYMDTANLTYSTYAGFEVVVGKSVNLSYTDQTGTQTAIAQFVDLSGSPNSVACNTTTNQCSIIYSQTINVGSQLVIDFDLAGFEVNDPNDRGACAQGNYQDWDICQVNVVTKAPPTTPPPYEFYATISRINTGDKTITVDWRGNSYTVKLDSIYECNDVEYDSNFSGDRAADCISRLQRGACIEIETVPGNNPANTSTVNAKEIETKDRNKCGSSAYYGEYYGVVQSQGDVNIYETPQDGVLGEFTLTLQNTNTITVKVTEFTKCEYEYGDMYGSSDEYMYGLNCLQNLPVSQLLEVKINSNGEALEIETED
ncbi:MAG: hypothetical protein GXO18_05290 [Aquificae bacterium]|nr:hypothetical protein [Aquificota bacterium]